MKLFSVKDMKAGLFFPPNCSRSIPEAIRNFESVANKGDNLFSQYPNDFRLFHLADFNEETGAISILEHMSDLGAAADFIRPQSANTLPFPKESRSN